jgi:predicted phosphodiesterase
MIRLEYETLPARERERHASERPGEIQADREATGDASVKIAVLSDIHGYSLAFDRVMEDIRSEPGIDGIVIAGDLCEGGPDPRGVLERIWSMEAVVLQGNTDRDIGHRDRSPASARYIIDAIGDDGLAYLRELRFSWRVSPPGHDDPAKDLLVVHANPFDQDRHIPPDAGDHELRELIGDTRAAVIAFGHLHIAYVRHLHQATLMDVSAVGNPKDGDLRSKWGFAEWSDEAEDWSVSLRYVDYPIAETEAQIRQSDMPNPEKVIEKLKKASY